VPENEKYYKKVKHYNTQGHAHELTFSCYRRRNYLCDTIACDNFISELQKAREEHRFQIWAYVLMPTHVHLLIWSMNVKYDIAEILNDAKGRMAKRYRDHVLSTSPEKYEEFAVFDKSKKRKVFRFWQSGGGFDRNLWNPKAIHDSIEYIEANPVRKKLCTSPEQYRWSSAYAREQNKGLVPDRFNMPVAMLDPRRQRVGVL
jgi:putative transposase